MKRFNRILLILVLGYSCFGIIIFVHIFHEQRLFYPIKGNWMLVWDDEFDGLTLDKTKWMADDRSCDYSSYRKEVQAISHENVTVKDGYLILASKSQEWPFSENTYLTTRYISGQVTTGDKSAWTFGRFEIRAKLPAGEGLLSYASLHPVYGKLSAEIPIMMMVGRDWYTIDMNHHGESDRLRHYLKEDVSDGNYPDFSTGFHTFAIEWEPRSICWYVDDVKMYQTDRNVPEIPLSLALGTTAGNLYLYYYLTHRGIVYLPQYLIVDWVRVYQKR